MVCYLCWIVVHVAIVNDLGPIVVGMSIVFTVMLSVVLPQGAYGIMCDVESHPFDLDTMLFMDWRDDHTADNADMRESNQVREHAELSTSTLSACSSCFLGVEHVSMLVKCVV